MAVVLDAGAFLAVERDDPRVGALVARERLAGRQMVTSGCVVGQVWRGGSGRQTSIARLLGAVDVVAVDDRLGRKAGLLLARTGSSDVVDATVVCLARDGDRIVTSDPQDLEVLVQAAALDVDVVRV